MQFIHFLNESPNFYENTLEMGGEDSKTTLEMGGEDSKITLEMGGEDSKTKRDDNTFENLSGG